MGVEEDDEQVDEVYRERKVGDEFGARDKDEEKYNTGQKYQHCVIKGFEKYLTKENYSISTPNSTSTLP